MIQQTNTGRRRILWRPLCTLAAAVILAVTFFAPAAHAQAATSSVTAPKAIRCGTGADNMGEIHVSVSSSNRRLKNIVATRNGTATNDLKCRVTAPVEAHKTGGNDFVITVYAKKTGTYKVKFDVCIGDRKTNSRTVTVYVSKYADHSLKSITFNGKKTSTTSIRKDGRDPSVYLGSNNLTGSLSVAPAEGMKIKKITLKSLKADGTIRRKTVTNGSTVTLGNVGNRYSGSFYGSGNLSFNPLWAENLLEIVFIDTWNNNTTFTDWYYLCPRAKKWAVPVEEY